MRPIEYIRNVKYIRLCIHLGFIFIIISMLNLLFLQSAKSAGVLKPKCLPTTNPCENPNPGCKREHWEITVWNPITGTWTKYTGESTQILLTSGHKKCQGKFQTEKDCTDLPRFCLQKNYYADRNCESLSYSELFDNHGLTCQED